MKIVFSLLAAALIGAGAYYALTRPAAPVYVEKREASGNPILGIAASSDDPYDQLITFDGETFVPEDITIKKGARVRFLNASDDEVWPASAVHPTHSIYPEKRAEDCLGSAFDACRGLKKGEFFAYTFNYTGEWRFHDHIRAYHTGSVTVTE